MDGGKSVISGHRKNNKHIGARVHSYNLAISSQYYRYGAQPMITPHWTADEFPLNELTTLVRLVLWYPNFP